MKLIGLATLLALSGWAQDQTPTFTSATRLVEVSVAVTDAAGRPIEGLARQDFTVQAGGRTRPVAFLQFDGGAGASRPAAPLPRFVFTNRAEFLPPESRNVTAIVIDSLNTAVNDDMRTRAQLMRYLRALPAGTRVALYQLTTRLRVLHDFTGDPEELRKKVAAARFSQVPGAEQDAERARVEADALLSTLGESRAAWADILERLARPEAESATRIKLDRLELVFEAMNALAAHLAPMPGRKNLVWAGGGLPMLHVMGGLGAGAHNRVTSFDARIRDSARRMAAANVVLTYFDTRGVIATRQHDAGSQNMVYTTEAQRVSEDARIGTSLLTRLTGGEYVNFSNSLATALERVERDQRASYTLAFYADEESDKWQPLAVKVNRAGARVRHREGYWLNEAAAGDAARRRTELAQPIGSAGILVNARCEPDPEGGPGALRLFAQIDSETLSLAEEPSRRRGALEVFVAEIDERGAMRVHQESLKVDVKDADWERVRREGVVYVRRWRPAGGAVRLRLLVEDTITKRTGALDVPLAAVLNPAAR